MHANVIYARWLYAVAGSWGLLILVPMFFLEDYFSRTSPPAITHPEYYYGFVGVAVAFQLLFLIIAADPVRYRPAMLAAIIEKFSYGIATLVLYNHGRVWGGPLFGGVVDLAFGVLFVAAYVMLRRNARYYA
ncbi:MAG: hypothetical protein WD845_17605 [Pirellulales bacterium]